MGYTYSYLEHGKLATPRGQLYIERVYNNALEAKKDGYSYYFTNTYAGVGAVDIYTKHLDVWHVNFAVIDVKSPCKCKQIAPVEWYAVKTVGYPTVVSTDSLIAKYKEASKTEDVPETFKDWVAQNSNIKRLVPETLIDIKLDVIGSNNKIIKAGKYRITEVKNTLFLIESQKTGEIFSVRATAISTKFVVSK